LVFAAVTACVCRRPPSNAAPIITDLTAFFILFLHIAWAWQVRLRPGALRRQLLRLVVFSGTCSIGERAVANRACAASQAGVALVAHGIQRVWLGRYF
jgi:hypothetical protein